MMISYFAVSFVYLTITSCEIVYENTPNEKHAQINEIVYRNDKNNQNSNLVNNDNSKTNFDDYYYEDNAVDGIQGIPGKDYPNYSIIPETSFSCFGKSTPGYYADIETNCQVFHICLPGGLKTSFLCPNGSVFNQMYSVCDWWYEVNCDSTGGIIDALNDVLKIQNGVYNIYDYPEENENHFYSNDLHLQSSGRNVQPSAAPSSDENIIGEKQNNDDNKSSGGKANGIDQLNRNENYLKNNQITNRRQGTSRIKSLNGGGNQTSDNESTKTNNNESSFHYVNLPKRDQIVPPSTRIEHNIVTKTDQNRNHVSSDIAINHDKSQHNNFNTFHYRGDVSDLRNSPNEVFYGGSIQNTFNKNYQSNPLVSATSNFTN